MIITKKKEIENMNDSNNTSKGGIGFCGLLAIAFIVLKLVGVIKWSWLWVLAPVWIPSAIGIVLLIILIVLKARWMR